MVLYHYSWSHPRGSLTSLVISFLILVHLLHAAADTPSNTLRKANCTGESYTPNSPFATNLATLLSSLTSKSSTADSATANITARNSSGSVYGLFMCQGDLSSSDCQQFIRTAAAAITQSCPEARQAIVWYDYCQLRYSDFNFFGIPDTAGFSMVNPNQKTSSSKPFMLVSDLVKTAPLQTPMFASKALSSDSLYGLAQCTADLSTDGCSKCLTTILADIKACCTQQQGWRYLAYSCWVHYEATPFLQNLNGTSTEIVRDNCSISTFPPNSLAVMESNLNNLLSNLTFKAQSTGFYNTTIGNSPNQVYGLALCRGDLIPPSDDCNTCLSDAGRSIAGDCPNSTAGIKWYEKCMMRYSDHNFFGVADLAGQYLCGVDQINQAVSDATLKFAAGLVGQAANNPLMVAAGEEQADNSSSSFVLVQCTRDLTSEGCKNCLQNGLNQVATQCKLTNGWRYLSGSCTLRYEVAPFFNNLVISPPGPPPTAPPQDGGEIFYCSYLKIKLKVVQ